MSAPPALRAKIARDLARDLATVYKVQATDADLAAFIADWIAKSGYKVTTKFGPDHVPQSFRGR